MFEAASIWDIPLVKPRFGCNFDPGLSVQGYDLGERVAKEFEAFKLGNKCETGFRAVQPSELNIKSSREFGVDGAPQDMPDLKDFRVSVMYRTFDGDARLFEMSIQTVMEHFPSAHELVAVVLDEDEALFQDIMDRHRASAPFPLRLVTEPAQMDAHLQHKFSKVWVGSSQNSNASREEDVYDAEPRSFLLSVHKQSNTYGHKINASS